MALISRSDLVVVARWQGWADGTTFEVRLRRLNPSQELILWQSVHRDRHVGVLVATDLGALTDVKTFLARRNERPRGVHVARDGVDLHAEGWHRKSVQHVRSRHVETDNRVGWDHNVVVGLALEEAWVATRVSEQSVLWQHVRSELDARYVGLNAVLIAVQEYS